MTVTLKWKTGAGSDSNGHGDTVQITPFFVDPNQQAVRFSPGARVTIGKRISDRIYLTYSRSLTSAARDQVIRYYRFTNSTASKLGTEPLPDGQVGHAGADLADQAGELVAHGQRRLDARVAVQERLQVGAADRTGIHFDSDFIIAAPAKAGNRITAALRWSSPTPVPSRRNQGVAAGLPKDHRVDGTHFAHGPYRN